MNAAVGYPLFDYQLVKAALGGVPPSQVRAVAGEGWLGIFEENQPLSNAPQPSSDPHHPTLFATWALEYTDVEQCLGEESVPVRQGSVKIAYWIQPGASQGPVLVAAPIFAEALSEVPSADAEFFPEGALSRVGLRDGWFVSVQKIRFIATGYQPIEFDVVHAGDLVTHGGEEVVHQS